MAKIAMPVVGDSLSMHFGHCEKFFVFDVDTVNKKVVQKEVIKAPPHEPGLLPRFLKEKGADVIIAGGMGARAKGLFQQSGIDVVVGVDAGAYGPEEIIERYLNGTLETGANICDH